MPIDPNLSRFLFLIPFLLLRTLPVFAGVCDLSVALAGTVYNYSLASPIPKHPHGVLSEDGFYKVAANGTMLWFQPCEQMIFNHDPPRCFDCQDCGGSTHCGSQCNALVSKDTGGYPVCTTIGKASTQSIALIDERYPNKGVRLKLHIKQPKQDCSLSLSIFCDSNKLEGPDSLDVLGWCDYSTKMTHPSGCPKVVSGSGGGGWFGTLLIVIICLLGAYLLAGTVYRYFFLGIHGPDVIPNLEFWVSLPHRGRILLGSLVRRLRGRSTGSRGSYTRANF